MTSFFQMNLKSVKPVRKQLHEMGELHGKISEISSAGPICEKLNQAESQTSSVEARLLEKVSLYLVKWGSWFLNNKIPIKT